MSRVSTSSAPTAGTFAPSAGSTWRTGLTSTGVALAANLAVLAVARLFGADMAVQQPASQTAITVGVGLVALMTLAPLLIATLLLLPLRRRGARAWRALALTGLVIGVITVPGPFTVLADNDTRAALASMHVLTGAIWFAVVRRAAHDREV